MGTPICCIVCCVVDIFKAWNPTAIIHTRQTRLIVYFCSWNSNLIVISVLLEMNFISHKALFIVIYMKLVRTTSMCKYLNLTQCITLCLKLKVLIGTKTITSYQVSFLLGNLPGWIKYLKSRSSSPLIVLVCPPFLPSSRWQSPSATVDTQDSISKRNPYLMAMSQVMMNQSQTVRPSKRLALNGQTINYIVLMLTF